MTIHDLMAFAAKPQLNPQVQAMHDFHVDVGVLGLTLDAEGRSQSINGRAAIAWTVKNRADGKGPKADAGKRIYEVCLRRLQYSCWFEVGGKENYERTMRMAETWMRNTLVGTIPVPIYRRLNESMWVATGVLQGRVLDPTGGATHYLTEHLFNNNPPRWVATATGIHAIEDHVFLRGVA